ncbi:MAG: 6,7-dimethyl-8-ribityllumazine synthase [Kiritimatiellales bacterium]|nr:6,7-dimethyl-8-ribityllumazine synthase [Kiritimatiellales bacterium]
MKNANASVELIKDINPEWRIGIVHSSFYKEDVQKMIDSAKKTLIDLGIKEQGISEHLATGSFEIPLIGSALADNDDVDALIGFGIVVQGETGHAEIIVEQAAKGMMDVQIRYKVPFAFEILHVQSLKDAQVRCESKGQSAANAVLHSLAQLRLLRS